MRKLLIAIFVLSASIAHAQVSVVESRFTQANAITVTASAYSSGNSVGGLLTFPYALCPRTNKGIVTGVVVHDKNHNGAAYNLILFSSAPSNSSTITDKTAITIADADKTKIVQSIAIATSNAITFSSTGVSTVNGLAAPVFGVVSAGNVQLYGVLQATGTPTYASTSDVAVTLETLCD